MLCVYKNKPTKRRRKQQLHNIEKKNLLHFKGKRSTTVLIKRANEYERRRKKHEIDEND